MNTNVTSYPILSTLPLHYRRVMVFDTETTGLLPKFDPVTKPPATLDQYPHIIQLSYMIWNLTTQRLDETYNAYVRIDPLVDLSPKITEITGITRETCDTNGVDIVEVLDRFYKAYLSCDVIVAHNLDFDRTVVLAEIDRHREMLPDSMDRLFSVEFNREHRIDLYCTMRATTNMCNLVRECPSKYPGGKPYQYNKPPKLSELYEYLFGETPQNLHNALVDVAVCLRCFLKVRCGFEIPKNRWNHM